ncbi:MAG: type II toxin-antitoxin system RelE/ParE family toxin [Saprospiraceae bacterium]|nr:type II toxin-antitoxin system RelE/ParE family toxin [Saprospiraceae bacterium]
MKVTFTDQAAEQLAELLDYLEIEWSMKVRDNFLLKLESTVEVIAAFPFAYPSSESYPDFRRCVVTPQTSLYYQIQPEEIEVVAVLDNRRDS